MTLFKAWMRKQNSTMTGEWTRRPRYEFRECRGHTANFKSTKKSYKSKKKIQNPPEKWQIIRDTHPAIIEQAQWDRVQELRKNKRRPTKTGKHSMFSSLVECADCGAKLYYCTTNYFEERQDHFVCSNYKSNTGNLHRPLYPGGSLGKTGAGTPGTDGAVCAGV